MVTTEPAVARARLIGLGLELYPANMPGSSRNWPHSIPAESFSSTPKSRRGKKGSGGRETLFVIYYRLYNDECECCARCDTWMTSRETCFLRFVQMARGFEDVCEIISD